MQDITEALNQIIFKYHLDRYYPHYRNMYEADRILRRLVKEIADSGERAAFVCDNEVGNGVIRSMAGGCDRISFLLYTRDDLKTLEAEDWKAFDRVYLTSFYDAEYALRWFWKQGIPCEWVYDLFEREGFCLEREFYALHRKIQADLWAPGAINSSETEYQSNIPGLELFFQKMRYKHGRTDAAQRIALEKCLFLCVYMKDFIQAKHYVDLLKKLGVSCEAMWQEVQALLDDIRSALRARKERDIVLYWLDALPYGGEDCMPYLKERMEASVCFEQAYCCTAYTHSVMRAMFLGKKEMEDHTYRIGKMTDENSPLIQLLKDQGYDIQVVSEYLNGNFAWNYLPDRFTGIYKPCSACFWDGLRAMLAHKHKTFFLFHTLDVHEPQFSGRYGDGCVQKRGLRYAAARRALDEQLAFYDSLVSEDAFRIYMSDHGQGELVGRYHVMLNFCHRTLLPQKVKAFVSILDFMKITKQMLLKRRISGGEFAREYIEIEELDFYNRAFVKKEMEREKVPYAGFFARKGIIDREHLYLRFRTGMEFLTHMDGTVMVYPSLFYESGIRDPELLRHYRELAGEFPADLASDPKFQYSQHLYTLYENVKRTSRMPDRVRLLNQMLDGYPEQSIAVRTGGWHAAETYLALSLENRRKIWGFIDRDGKCKCEAFHLPIVPLDAVPRLPEEGVRAVLLSSWDYLEQLRAEAAGYERVDILDIYAYFDQNGLGCKGNFYEVTDLPPEFWLRELAGI